MSDDIEYEIEEIDEEPRGNRTRFALVAILVILFLMLAGLGYLISRVVTPAGSPRGLGDTPVGLEWVRSLYGYGPKAEDMFYRPLDTAIAPDGTIYGTDPQRVRILVFEPDGDFRTLVHRGPEGTGEGQMYRPDRVVTDEEGNLYVADGGNGKVLVFSPEGKLLREWSVPAPTDIAVRGKRVYVATAYGVAACQLDGTLIAAWGRRGSGPEEFDNPHGVTIADDGTVYVSDTLNARIKAYTPEGRLKWIWPKDRTNAEKSGIRPRTGKSALQVPTGICLDGRGRIVLVDPFTFEIVVLQPSEKSARLVARYGSPGVKDGYFQYPDGISYDPARDWFAVADTLNDRVQIVRIPGSANALAAAMARARTGPLWLCALPLLLLLAAIVVALMRRRARTEDAEDAGGEPDEEDEPAESAESVDNLS